MENPAVELPREQERRVIALEYASKLIDYSAPDADKLIEAAGAIEKFIKGPSGG